MGLIKLAILGGAGYYAVKKINGNNHNKQCQGHCNHHTQNNHPQNREVDDFNAGPQHYSPAEKNPPQYPQYRDQPDEKTFHDHLSEPFSYPNEKGGMQQVKN